MAERDWETIKRAVEELNSGKTESSLDLCSDGVVLHLGQDTTRPIGSSYYGRDSVRELWHETVESTGGTFEVKPLRMLSDGRHLVLFVEAVLGSGPDRRTRRVIVTGTAGADGRWGELWAQFDDQPLEEEKTASSD
jgi:hypothetical protein